MNRVSAHLGRNVRSNALRRYLKSKRDVELEACLSLDFFAFGPVYPEPEAADYPTQRGKVAALERHLWLRLKDAGYEMLNAQPAARAELDKPRWRDVCCAFKQRFQNLAFISSPSVPKPGWSEVKSGGRVNQGPLSAQSRPRWDILLYGHACGPTIIRSD